MIILTMAMVRLVEDDIDDDENDGENEDNDSILLKMIEVMMIKNMSRLRS